ncbi:MAG TPA: polyphosphate kinase 2 family protein [Terriglobales bacterium]|nr:polyphosphate kinase 2 family protein [Terriglobales bacterium]
MKDSQYLVRPNTRLRLAEYDPADTGTFKDRDEADAELKDHRKRLFELQELFYAEDKHAFLVVLQGMDAAGKDGAIRHIFTGVNPQGCEVHSFKEPAGEETQHDYLWRVHKVTPRRGMIGVFNRSHYEDVLVVRVHQQIPQRMLAQRFEQINAFERTLAENNTTLLKFFLHISKEEQRKRLQARLDHSRKYWKVSPSDLAERKLWDDYQKAYEDVFYHCNAAHAPWYIIPANKKWFRNVLISRILVRTLEALKMHYPKPQFDLTKLKVT